MACHGYVKVDMDDARNHGLKLENEDYIFGMYHAVTLNFC